MIEADESYQDENFDTEDFSQRALTDCTFSNCSFIGTNFRAADLSRSEFYNCQFNDSESQDAADFSQANLKEVRFERCNLTVVEFVRCTGYGLRFEHCQMQGSDLSKSDFRMPIGNVDMVDLALIECNASYANFANNYLSQAIFEKCRLLETCFDYCDLSEADLRGSEIHNISAVGMVIRGADLRGTAFNNINPREIELDGVKLYYDQLIGLFEPLGLVVEDRPEALH